VVALGNDAQVAALDDSLDSGALGCFALTEKLAGVNSGMVVNTTMDWDADAQEFILTTPDEGAHKNWISQGYTADKALVVADLRVDGTSCGPHGFIMDLRTGGELVDGVSLGDMGVKTTGNDLDNAWIAFDNVRLPKSALLNRYSDVVEDKFVQKQAGVTAMAMIGQRLFTGRIAVAQAALAFRKELFKRTKVYADNKKTWAPKGEPMLSGIPQLKALFEEADATAGKIEAFVGQCEAELAVCLREDVIPPTELTDAIAVCKVQAVEASIDLCFRLKQEVGSFALMADSGFAHQDFLQCCKFAEGDSRILMQKFARDQMRSFAKGNPLQAEEQALCEELAGLMGKDMEASGANKMEAWDNQWEKVYELARATMKRIVADRT
jgi:alkylation response protein AidB-like acyl-CoA dehydrogenase